MTSNTLPARDRSIDILKGFGILLMICGHIGFGTPFIQFCASFYMPLFYVVSGYLLNGRRPFGSFVLKKAKGLLVPYYAFAPFNHHRHTPCAPSWAVLFCKWRNKLQERGNGQEHTALHFYIHACHNRLLESV